MSGTALDFPSGPAIGDDFVSPNDGRIWLWDGDKWVCGGGFVGGGASVTISDVAPVGPGDGDLWWDTDSAKLFLWDGLQWIIVVNTPYGAGSQIIVSATEPPNPVSGMMWFDGHELYLRVGPDWRLIGGQPRIPPGVNWVIRQTPPTTTVGHLTSAMYLFYFKGRFIVPVTRVSTDGVNWTQTTFAGNYGSFSGASYAQSADAIILVRGATVAPIKTTDGTTWNEITGLPHNSWSSIAYGNGVWVLTSREGLYGTIVRLMTSTDEGVTWIARETSTVPVSRVFFDGTKFILLRAETGVQGVTSRVTSIDGVTWTPPVPTVNAPTTASIWDRFLCAPGIIIATAYSASHTTSMPAYSTDDGVTWITSTFPPPATPSFVQASAIHENGMFFLIARRGNNGNNYNLFTSLDGINWTVHRLASDMTPYGIAYGAGRYVISGHASGFTADALMTSADASVWTMVTTSTDHIWRSVAFGNNIFVAVSYSGAGNRVMSSPDGVTWTLRSSAADNAWNGVCFGNNLFVAVAGTGLGNRVMTSPDGINWTSRASAADELWTCVTYGNGVFVALAYSGTGNRAMRSTDGIIWTSQTTPADGNWRSVVWGGDKFVAVADAGFPDQIMTSPDGITWTLRTSPANSTWYSVTYGDGRFVAVAYGGTNRVMYSDDGISWTSTVAATTNSWTAVAYGDELFAAVAASGTGNRVMTSTNGETWTLRSSAADNSWQALAFGDGRFVAVATTGTNTRAMTSVEA